MLVKGPFFYPLYPHPELGQPTAGKADIGYEYTYKMFYLMLLEYYLLAAVGAAGAYNQEEHGAS